MTHFFCHIRLVLCILTEGKQILCFLQHEEGFSKIIRYCYHFLPLAFLQLLHLEPSLPQIKPIQKYCSTYLGVGNPRPPPLAKWSRVKTVLGHASWPATESLFIGPRSLFLLALGVKPKSSFFSFVGRGNILFRNSLF